MAMQPYNISTYGQMVATGTYPYQNYVQNRIVASRSLSGVYSTKGNFVTPNPHSYTALKSRGYLGHVHDSAPSYYGNMDGAMPFVFNWQIYDAGRFDANVYNEALSRMYSALRGNVDLSVDLVQWRKTLQMLSIYRRLVNGIARNAVKLLPQVDRIDKLRADLSDIKRGSRRARRLGRELNSAINALASARLEYVYGWRPTVTTLQALAKGVLRTDKGGLMKLEGKAQRVETHVIKQYAVDPTVPVDMHVTTSSRARIVCFYNPQPGLLDNLSRISSLNPVSLLYEATPFSFVLDWAVNFSEYLRALETAFVHRNDFAAGYVTQVRRTTVEAYMNGTIYVPFPHSTNYMLRGTGIMTTFSRSILLSAPFPTRPVVQKDFGINRLLNALALAKTVWPKADAHIASKRR